MCEVHCRSATKPTPAHTPQTPRIAPQSQAQLWRYLGLYRAEPGAHWSRDRKAELEVDLSTTSVNNASSASTSNLFFLSLSLALSSPTSLSPLSHHRILHLPSGDIITGDSAHLIIRHESRNICPFFAIEAVCTEQWRCGFSVLKDVKEVVCYERAKVDYVGLHWPGSDG